jgi:hypothetical protein
MTTPAASPHQDIMLQPAFLVADDLKSSALIELMPDLGLSGS